MMKHMVATALIFTMLMIPATGIAADVSYPLVGAPDVYTLVNLHPDETRHRLYSVNYQEPGLIPLCSKVRIDSIDTRRMKFRVLDTGREYDYIFHNSLRDPVEKHLDKYFGKTCDRNKINEMSETDRQGILAGTVSVGMTKEGVILAIGYPPEHATPTLESNTWTYWKNRFGKKRLEFSDNKVSEIKN